MVLTEKVISDVSQAGHLGQSDFYLGGVGSRRTYYGDSSAPHRRSFCFCAHRRLDSRDGVTGKRPDLLPDAAGFIGTLKPTIEAGFDYRGLRWSEEAPPYDVLAAPAEGSRNR